MNHGSMESQKNQDLKRMLKSLPVVVGNLLNSEIEILGIRTELQTRRETEIQVSGDFKKLVEWAKVKGLRPAIAYHTPRSDIHFWTLDYKWQHIKVFQVLCDEEREALAREAL